MARMFPSYTTAQLRAFLETDQVVGAQRAKMEAEIIARETGASVPAETPQIIGGKVQHRVGRL